MANEKTTTTADDARKAGLSEQEIDGIKEAEAAQRMAAVDPKATDEEDDDKAKPAEPTPAETEGEDPAKPVTEPEAKDTRQTPFVPTYNAVTPEGLDARLAAIKTEQRELKVKFGAEMLTDPDTAAAKWADADAKLQEERDQLLELRNNKTRMDAQNHQTIQQAIQSERKAFLREAKRDGIDYSDPKLATKLDTAYNVIANLPERANGRVDDIYDMWAEAGAMVKAMIGWKPPAPSIVKTDPKSATPRDAPKTLGGLPSAAPAETGDDTLAKFNQLEGEDAERYLASLPKKEVDRLMKLAG